MIALYIKGLACQEVEIFSHRDHKGHGVSNGSRGSQWPQAEHSWNESGTNWMTASAAGAHSEEWHSGDSHSNQWPKAERNWHKSDENWKTASAAAGCSEDWHSQHDNQSRRCESE